MTEKTNKRFKWTSDQEKQIKERYRTDGPTVLAKELNTTVGAVISKARRMGLPSTRKKPPKNFKWTDEMLAAVKERYVAEGPNKLAKEFGLATGTVQRKAVEFDLRTNAGHERWGRERAESNDCCNTRYFDSWSPSMAYVLGFIFADGSISGDLTRLDVNVTRRDEDVLRFIRSELQARAPLKHNNAYKTSKFNARAGSGLVVCGKVLCESLVRRGCHPRKTYRDDPFPDVPDDMLPHFIRGYFDGDGCVSIYKGGRYLHCETGFVGSIKFITGLRDKLVQHAGVRNRSVQIKKGKDVDHAHVSWGSASDLPKLHKFMYPDGYGFAYQRKQKKLAAWLVYPQNPRGNWVEFEEEMVRRYYWVLRIDDLSVLLNKDADAIRAKAELLGVIPNNQIPPKKEQ